MSSNFSPFDKKIEKLRYDQRAKNLQSAGFIADWSSRSRNIGENEYIELVTKNLSSGMSVLELCAGLGEFTHIFSDIHSVNYFITDISENSLQVNRKNNAQIYGNYISCDIENLPFLDEKFDLVVCAGGLSYGDHSIVCREIYRTLKVGGKFIALDVLDENPIYKVNRYLNYLRKKRTYDVVKMAPNKNLIKLYSKYFKIRLFYFGSIIWALPVLKLIFSDDLSLKIIRRFDSFISTKNSAFKVIFLCVKDA